MRGKGWGEGRANMKNSPVRGRRRSSPAAGVDALSPISAWGACAACAVCAACVVSAACDTADCCHRRCSSSRGPDSSRNRRPSPPASPSPLFAETRTGRRPLDFRLAYLSSRVRVRIRVLIDIRKRKMLARRCEAPDIIRGNEFSPRHLCAIINVPALLLIVWKVTGKKTPNKSDLESDSTYRISRLIIVFTSSCLRL